VYRAAVGLAYTDEAFARAAAVDRARAEGRDSGQDLDALRNAFSLGEVALKDAVAFTPRDYQNYGYLASLYNVAGVLLDKAYTRGT
jgi:hypothetical protein